MKIQPGKLVLVRPSRLKRDGGSGVGDIPDDTVFRVWDDDGHQQIIVEAFDPSLCLPWRLAVGFDDVIEYVPPPKRPDEPRDALTGLTATEEATAYRQRRDANLQGVEPLPCIGWEPSTLTFHTPHGPITLALIRQYEGTLLSHIPDQIRPALAWLCNLTAPAADELAAHFRNERTPHVHD